MPPAIVRLCSCFVVWLGVTSASPAPSPSHEISIRFDSTEPSLTISGLWRMPPRAQDSDQWTFYLSPVMTDVTITRLICGSSEIKVKALHSEPEGGDMLWHLTGMSPCPAAKPLTLWFRYKTARNAPQLQVTPNAAFAGGGGEYWYPQRAYKDLDTAVIRIDVPATFKTIATGDLVGSAIKGALREDIYRARNPSKLAFAIGRYTDVRLGRPFPIRLLTTSASAARARGNARLLSRLLAPLERAFGPAPQRSLALVEVRFGGKVAGTSEYGMIFAEPEQFSGPFNPSYWAHEFSHQWWGISVRNRAGAPGSIFLTEGMAQYGALLGLENAFGRAAAAAYRATDVKDSIMAYRKLVAAGQDRALVGEPPNGQEEILRMHRLATSKGAILISQLAWLIGRDRFHRTLRQFLARNRGQSVAWADLENAINADTQQRYRWWFDQWLRAPAAPDFEVSTNFSGNRVEIAIRQYGPKPYRLMIPVEVCGRWGTQELKIPSSASRSTTRVKARGPVTDVRIDPDVLVPNLRATARSAVRCPRKA